jgi:hypothetical protein
MSLAFEKLEAATMLLAGSAPIKERLTTAYRQHLALIDATELPRDVREDFSQLCKAMQRERPLSRGEDAIVATVRKMSIDEADRHAVTVVRMFCAVSRTWTSAAVLRSVITAPAAAATTAPTTSAEVVQLFAGSET